MFDYEDEEDGLTPKERAINELTSRRTENELNILLVNSLRKIHSGDSYYGSKQ